MNQSFWKPGSIVKLNEPYKPSCPDAGFIEAIRDYREWQGFTHGVIAQVYAHDHQGNASNISLFLYDPLGGLIYVEDFANGIPTYVDFHVEEVIPLKDGETVGYTTIKQA